MIAIIDYKMGNLRSVENALRRLDADFCVTADAGCTCSPLRAASIRLFRLA